MVYLLLAAGIVFTVLGIRGIGKSGTVPAKIEGSETEDNFSGYLSDSIVLKRLDSIEEKLDLLCDISDVGRNDNDDGDQLSLIDDMGDINKAILIMKNRGTPLEEIAAKFGVTKGEVLLRLGMKK